MYEAVGSYWKFAYELDTLFNYCVNQSMYRVRNAVIDNKTLIDHYGMTEDDRNFFDMQIKRSGADVFKKISKLAEGITDAYQFEDENDSSTSIINEAECIAYTLSFDGDWDENLLNTFDIALMDALINHILAGWFRTNRLLDVASECMEDFERNLTNINSLTMYRTTPTKRKYNTGFN